MIDKILLGIIILFSLFALFIFAHVPMALKVEADCLAREWPDSQVTWDFKGYCKNYKDSVPAK